jgi:uncharacterized PurR-regulated membrane protein YhhQ (DUF165 family)
VIYVLLYIGAACAANVVIALYGPSASIICAFLFIGLNITVRDKLHDRWQGNDLALRMLLLIMAGGLLSYIVYPSAGRIGIASMIAFIFSETTDALIYGELKDKPWIIRSNASNIGAALIDSLLFPTIAFASLLPLVVLFQFLAKVGGGFFWSILLQRGKDDKSRNHS